MQQLTDLINAEWPQWGLYQAVEPSDYERAPKLIRTFSAGLNHTTALINAHQRYAVIKLFSRPVEREIVVQKWAAELGIAPQLLFVDKRQRYIVMDYAKSNISDKGGVSNSDLRALAHSLKKVHSADGGPISERGFDILRFCETYLGAAGQKAQQLHKEVVGAIIEFQHDTTPWCFCHNDLVAANCLLMADSGHGSKAMFIDWEYADRHNPWFDLAALIYYQNLSDEQVALLLGHYNHGWPQKDQQRIILASQIALLWGDILWHLDKFGEAHWVQLSTKEQDLNRLVRRLNTLS